jgi:heme exporter protein C
MIKPLVILNAVLMTLALVMIACYAPVDAAMGLTQKIFYIHLPSALACFLATGVVFCASAAYLFKPSIRTDYIAHAAASPAWIFCTLTLMTGMIWARQAWSVWWAWDARLTSFLILWCILSVYLVLRRSLSDGPLRARLSAAFGILGFLDVPLVFFSIHWWNTLHPTVITAGRIQMDPPMLWTLAISASAILMLTGLIVGLRYKLLRAEHRLSAIIQRVNESNESL